MLTASLLAALAFVASQQKEGPVDLEGVLGRTVDAAFEGADAACLGVTVLIGETELATFHRGPPGEPCTASIDGGAHALLSALAMQLQDRGKLDVEQAVSRWLPELGPAAGAITLHQLMTHTAALPPWEELDGPTPELRLAAMAARGTTAQPGTCFRPSTGDTFALALALKRELRENVLERAATDVLQRSGAHALPCEHPASGLASALGEPELCVTSADWAAFLRGLAGRNVLSESSWSAMTTADLLPDGTRTRYGHGLELARLGEIERVACGGSGGGSRLFVARYPALELTIAVVASGTVRGRRFDGEALATSLARLVGARPAPAVRDLPVDAALASRLAGEYLIGCDRTRIGHEGGRLVLTLLSREPIVLLQQTEDEFVAAEGRDLVVRFTKGGDRAVGFLLIDQGWETRAVRIDGKAPLRSEPRPDRPAKAGLPPR